MQTVFTEGLPPQQAPVQSRPMTKLCTLAGATILGYGAWWLADAAGFGFFAAFLISGLGSVLGVYLGWKLAQKLE